MAPTDSDRAFEMMRDALQQNQTDHAQIRKAITSSHAEIRQDIENVLTAVMAQNGRVRKLELWRNGITAIGLFIAAVFGAMKWFWKPGG